MTTVPADDPFAGLDQFIAAQKPAKRRRSLALPLSLAILTVLVVAFIVFGLQTLAITSTASQVKQPANPALEPFEASDANGHLVSRGYRIRRADGNYVRAGEWTFYFLNGLVKEQGTYSDDKKSEVWSFYEINTGYDQNLKDDEHYLDHKERYENGEVVYRWVYSYSPWIVSAEGPVREGENHGKWTAYSADGSMKSESIYEWGRVVGWTMFDKSGGVFATFADDVYTLHGVKQNKSAIPGHARLDRPEFASYSEDAWQHAFKLWPLK
jgi:hypothetical protein